MEEKSFIVSLLQNSNAVASILASIFAVVGGYVAWKKHDQEQKDKALREANEKSITKDLEAIKNTLEKIQRLDLDGELKAATEKAGNLANEVKRAQGKLDEARTDLSKISEVKEAISNG